jgi:predicted amidohydrolase YtcJ
MTIHPHASAGTRGEAGFHPGTTRRRNRISSTPCATAGVAALVAAASLLASACDPDPANITPERPVETIEITPGAVLLTRVGESRPLAAAVHSSSGASGADFPFVWAVEDEAVAEVDADGIVTALAAGTSRVTATLDDLSAHADLHVLESDAPPVVFHGGPVLTIDPVTRVEEALVVVGERIFRVGAAAELLAMVADDAVRVNLGGRALMPGFVDPHNHVYNAVYHQRASDEVGTTYAEAQERLIRAGTTTMANGNSWPDAFQDFLGFVESGGIRARTRFYLGWNDVCGGIWPEGWYLAHAPSRDPEALFGVPGVKFFKDGGACNRGAFTFYADAGDLYLTATELAEALVAVQEQGYQALIHTLGDIAADSVHAALEAVFAGGPNVHRHRMDHNRYLRDWQFPRYSEVGAIPVVFGSPFTCAILDGGSWSFLMNEQYAALRPRLDPWRALLDANPGHPVAWKSDAPTNWPLEPLLHLWGLVTRNEQRADGSLCEAPDWLSEGAIHVQEALPMMTINAAYVLHMDDAVGSLEPGKLADVVILSDNPLTVPSASLRDLHVLMTMIGGKVEHCAQGAEEVCPGG